MTCTFSLCMPLLERLPWVGFYDDLLISCCIYKCTLTAVGFRYYSLGIVCYCDNIESNILIPLDYI